jgi:hypothetical protein
MNLDAMREKRQIINANMAWRKTYLESCRATQNKLERNSIVSVIDSIPPGMRVVYLRARLAKLKARLESTLEYKWQRH